MVHRAPDSRLLTNLIANEKEVVKHLVGLVPLSHAALASLSAYAATSPAHPSSPAQTIVAVVDALAGADDALQRYTQAVDTWRTQLVVLKDLEDDLAAILRDRDILVTRLIKASKSTHRSSRLITPLSGLGSPSLSSLPSSNSTTPGTSIGPASTNSKLAQAQVELQACEAHLATKERELDARRISVAREGLGVRCRALVDCGWVWGEMGKQGLKALQALGASASVAINSGGHSASKLVPPASATVHPNTTNPTTYASDNSSLTPSQSASQTASRSGETTSHENPTSVIEAQLEINSRPPTAALVCPPCSEEEGDLTITLPPAHAISDLAFPTGVHTTTPQNGDAAPAQKSATSDPLPVLRRKRSKRPRRPPSHHILEVSDEGSDAPGAALNRNAQTNANAAISASPRLPRAPFPTTLPDPGTQGNESSSDDAHPVGPFEVVENDPFEMIRRSVFSPSASAVFEAPAPVPKVSSAHASAPDVRAMSPFKAMLPGSGPGTTPSPAKRERRTSMAFFGSLRGLFRKPKERGQISTDWDEGNRAHSPTSPGQTRTRANGGGGGWVTRTDRRIKASRDGGGTDDSDEAPTAKDRVTTPTSQPVARSSSGARLRKGRPGGASTRGIQENVPSPSVSAVASSRAGISTDGWITDGPADVNVGTDSGTALGRSRMRRATMKRRKVSVADLRGSDQGHTDGEVDRAVVGGRGSSLQPASSKARSKSPEVAASGSWSASKRGVDVKEEEAERKTREERSRTRKGSTSENVLPVDKPVASPNPNASPGSQPRRATTTTANSSRKSSSGNGNRRSASLSLASTYATPLSQTPSPPRSQSPSRSPSQQTETETETPVKQNARRALANGHATHAHKHKHTHAQSPSLMSIVADVTRPREDERRENEGPDKSRSLDMERGSGQNGHGHARSSSSPTGGQVGSGQGQAQGGQRAIKMPLRSALRNASRTPSPSPASTSVSGSGSVAGTPTILRVVPPVGNGKGVAQVEEDAGRRPASPRDSASVSSYETGRESFYVEEREGVPSPSPVVLPRLQSPPPRSEPPMRPFSFSFPPPPVEPPPAVPAPVQDETIPASSNATEQPSSSNVSTETRPVRRKSVRVSLPPTFSPTPPAMYDEDGEGYAPWTESFSARDEGNGERERGKERGREREGRQVKPKTKGGTQEDMWVDSSEEDEVYSRARHLLSMVRKKEEVAKDKGKGKARA